MPKQLTRGQAARTVTLQVTPKKIHCRRLDQAFQDIADKARLRGVEREGAIELQLVPHRDTVIQRLFSRDEIAAERQASRRLLALAAANLTPQRLSRLGSPGRRAVLVLQGAAALSLDCDIKVGQVRNAIALLAGNKKTRSFIGSPARAHSARLAQHGATALASADSVRRVQLNRFCMDSTASKILPGLLAAAGDSLDAVAASLSIFRAAALSFIIEHMFCGTRASQESIARQIRKNHDSALLRCFIAGWRRATAAGKVKGSAFAWFDAVDWLVGAMHIARPASPGATRAPRSPRVVSPLAALRRAQTAAPAPRQAARRLRTRTATPARPADVRRRATMADVVLDARRLQEGRQGASLQMLHQLPSPTRLADAPARATVVVSTVARVAAPSRPVFRPARNPASAAPVISRAEPPGRSATLLDMVLEYSASQSPATSVASEADSHTGQMPDQPRGDALPDSSQ